MNVDSTEEDATAQASTSNLSPSHEPKGLVSELEEKSNDEGVTKQGVDGDTATELLRLMREMAGRIDHLEASQNKLQKDLAGEQTRLSDDQPMTPETNSSLFESALGRGPRMHLDSLVGTPITPPAKKHHPSVPPQYFGQQQPGYGMPRSQLQQLYAAAMANQGVREPRQEAQMGGPGHDNGAGDRRAGGGANVAGGGGGMQTPAKAGQVP